MSNFARELERSCKAYLAAERMDKHHPVVLCGDFELAATFLQIGQCYLEDAILYHSLEKMDEAIRLTQVAIKGMRAHEEAFQLFIKIATTRLLHYQRRRRQLMLTFNPLMMVVWSRIPAGADS